MPAPHPPSRRIRSRHAILALLTALNLFNYLDRYVVNAVAPRIRTTFALSEWQTGWVVSAFMLGYLMTSPAFGALGDRGPRKGLIAAGVLVWSAATAASGLAGGLATLLLARVVVGVGEACDATISPTIIDDLTPPAAKSRSLALFYAAIPLGSALGYVVGGQVDRALGWRSAFLVAAVPGAVLALLVPWIDEPPRAVTATPSTRGARAVAALLGLPTYRDAVLGYVAYTFALGGFAAWAPTYLERRLALPLHVADVRLGAILAVTGLAGTAIGGVLGDRWPGRDRPAAQLAVCALATALAVPFAIAALLADAPSGFFAATAATELLLFVATAPVNAALLGAVPVDLRASAMAASIFAIHLFGDLVSPPVIGRIADVVRGASPASVDAGTALRTALLPVPLALGVAAAVWGRAARRRPARAG